MPIINPITVTEPINFQRDRNTRISTNSQKLSADEPDRPSVSAELPGSRVTIVQNELTAATAIAKL